MLNPGMMYMLTSVVLSAVAVVVHFHVAHLSLPLSSAITVLAVVLPIAAFLNAYIYPNLLRASHPCAADPNPSTLARLAPVVLQGCQAIVTAILATLLLEGVVPSPVLDFLLDSEWGAMVDARSAGPIELIQDTYDCCGLNAVDDRAYPFSGNTTCAVEYARVRSCGQPWRSAMQATSALDFAVVLAVGLMQIIGLLMMRERTRWWTALRTHGWKGAGFSDCSSQRLLYTSDDDDTVSCAGSTNSGYGTLPGRKPAPFYDAQRNAAHE
ncbi:hypothetical protein HIM_00346 [Hirsutella minnesotensis 3608]|nr:hypothetical protein HIM_00346 [Hirsutella minnesotensis 3608]